MPPTGQIERIEGDIVLIMLFLGRHSGSFITTPRPPIADLSGFSLDSPPPAPPPRAHGTKSGHLVHLLHCSGKRRNGERGHEIGPLGAGLTSEKYTELGWRHHFLEPKRPRFRCCIHWANAELESGTDQAKAKSNNIIRTSLSSPARKLEASKGAIILCAVLGMGRTYTIWNRGRSIILMLIILMLQELDERRWMGRKMKDPPLLLSLLGGRP